MEPVAIGVGLVIVMVLLRLLAGSMDHGRIDEYIRSRGGRLISKVWNPLGRGWSGDKNRIYELRFIDADGNEHEATCKTSLFAGVYLTEDRIVRQAQQSVQPQTPAAVEDPGATLQSENHRLRQRLRELGQDPDA